VDHFFEPQAHLLDVLLEGPLCVWVVVDQVEHTGDRPREPTRKMTQRLDSNIQTCKHSNLRDLQLRLQGERAIIQAFETLIV
jgi:hypothetical protein